MAIRAITRSMIEETIDADDPSSWMTPNPRLRHDDVPWSRSRRIRQSRRVRHVPWPVATPGFPRASSRAMQRSRRAARTTRTKRTVTTRTWTRSRTKRTTTRATTTPIATTTTTATTVTTARTAMTTMTTTTTGRRSRTSQRSSTSRKQGKQGNDSKKSWMISVRICSAPARRSPRAVQRPSIAAQHVVDGARRRGLARSGHLGGECLQGLVRRSGDAVEPAEQHDLAREVVGLDRTGAAVGGSARSIRRLVGGRRRRAGSSARRHGVPGRPRRWSPRCPRRSAPLRPLPGPCRRGVVKPSRPHTASIVLPRFISSLRYFHAMMSSRGIDPKVAARSVAASSTQRSSTPCG